MPFNIFRTIVPISAFFFLTIPAASAATEPVEPIQPCAPGIQLRLSALQAHQGSLLSVILMSSKPLTEIKGTWDGHELPFWVARQWGKGTTEHQEALLGVDLEKAPSTYELALSGKTTDGTPFDCKASVTVTPGHFATESLHVAKQFAEPDEEQTKRANAERERLRAIFDQITPQPLWKGGFRKPLDIPSTGGNFGKRRILNGIPGSPHSGIDFPAPTGTPIHAAQAGKVVLAEELYFSGNTVVIDHGLGIYTFYGHLSEIGVKVGDELQSGHVLGKVGATGRVTGPHLHWGLYVNHARVNGLDILRILGQK
jgi:murein DD-endopeptidase MepM/ murein hydrolase activator NlpD